MENEEGVHEGGHTSSRIRFLALVMAPFKALIQDSFSSGLTARKTRFGTWSGERQEAEGAIRKPSAPVAPDTGVTEAPLGRASPPGPHLRS